MSYPNPIVRLPAYRRLELLPVESRDALASVLRDLGDDCAARANESWRRNKGPMAAYWKAAGVYARHIARSLDAVAP